MKMVCVFDLNGTVFDNSVLDGWFAVVFGSSEIRQLWQEKVLHSTLVWNEVKSYKVMATISESTLIGMAEEREIELSENQLQHFRELLNALPLYSDVKGSLDRLRAEGYRIAALTNLSELTAQTLLARANIDSYFEKVISTDSIKKFKPLPRSYERAARDLTIPMNGMWFITAHAWDLTGAVAAGAFGALIRRPGHGMTSLHPKPDAEGGTLVEVTEMIVQKDKSLFDRLKEAI